MLISVRSKNHRHPRETNIVRQQSLLPSLAVRPQLSIFKARFLAGILTELQSSDIFPPALPASDQEESLNFACFA
jgi:hypothetical protein